MNSSEEQKGPGAPGTGGTPSAGEPAVDALQPNPKPFEAAADGGGVSTPYDVGQQEDGYPHEPENVAPVSSSAPPLTPVVTAPSNTSNADDSSGGAMMRLPGQGGGGGKTPPPPSDGDGGDD